MVFKYLPRFYVEVTYIMSSPPVIRVPSGVARTLNIQSSLVVHLRIPRAALPLSEFIYLSVPFAQCFRTLILKGVA